tara:strand:+ start:1610 stop:2395 length:786 start_codon:yes stop_codon:yes gene_type:complete
MLKTKDWIYLDLEKTGGTFLTKKLVEIFAKNKFEKIRKHSPQEIIENVPKIITIREPNSYYFSLWTYGLEKKGNFYKKIKRIYPNKADLFYAKKTKDSFSYFLDFALNYPLIKPNKNIYRFNSWIPGSSDVYTSRILRMLIPQSEKKTFSEKIKSDLSLESLNKNLINYIPEIILRTSSLNDDFYDYFKKNKLNFLNLPKGWETIFPLNSLPINKSKFPSSLEKKSIPIESYFSSYHKDLIELKCKLSLILIERATSELSN